MRKLMTIALFLGIAFSALQSGLIGINKGDVADINTGGDVVGAEKASLVLVVAIPSNGWLLPEEGHIFVRIVSSRR